MNNDEAKELLTAMSKLWPAWVPEADETRVWFKKLQHYKLAAAMEAKDEYFARCKRKTPNLAEFRECIRIQPQAYVEGAFNPDDRGYSGVVVMQITPPFHYEEMFFGSSRKLPPPPVVLDIAEDRRKRLVGLYGGEWRVYQSVVPGTILELWHTIKAEHKAGLVATERGE